MPPTGPPPLTLKQQHILALIRDDPAEVTTADLAQRLDSKIDPMRRMLERLTVRKLVRGAGQRGATRRWALTDRGSKEIGDREPAPLVATPDRTYVVLEQTTLDRLMYDTGNGSAQVNGGLPVIVVRATVDARNTEDAYRKAVKECGMTGKPVLAAVASRYWQPIEVPVEVTHTISIGRSRDRRAA